MLDVKKIVKLSVLLLLVGNVRVVAGRSNVFRGNRAKVKREWQKVMFVQVVVSSGLGALVGSKLKSMVKLNSVWLVPLIGMFLGTMQGVLVQELIKLDGGDVGVSLSGALAGMLVTQDLFDGDSMLLLSYVLSVGVGSMLELVLGCPYVV